MPLRTVSVFVVTAATLAAAAGLASPVLAATAQPGAVASKDAANVTTGTIDAVTVYRGQALVTRVLDVPGGAGLREIVVTGLPEAIIPASLYAESSEGVEVRSVSYRVRPVGEDARDSVRAAEKALRDAKDALEGAKSREKYMEWQRQYLDKLENFIAPTAQAELKSGVLNAETLTKLTDMATTRRKAQTEEWQKLNIELRALSEAVQLRERELNVLAASTSRTAREAVVFVNATRPGARLRLSYLVNGADWSPSYNLRIPGADAQKATMEYQASVQQMSGEDWGSVQLTLSTATPALVATGPSLRPLSVALASPQQAQTESSIALYKDKSYEEAKKAIAVQQREAERNRALIMNFNPQSNNIAMQTLGQPVLQNADVARLTGDGSAGESRSSVVYSLDTGLNEAASVNELIDLVSAGKVERKGKSEPVAVRQGDEGLSVTYKVSTRTSMPSRADQQLIQIASMELPAKIVKVATPALTQYVYNEAQVTNTGNMVLLAGPASSYLAGEFVGSAGVPTVAAGESFRAGFGIDSSLRAAKELVERTESFEGGNRIIEFTYKLTIENFGSSPAALRIMDRVPSSRGTDIKLTMVDQKPPLSDDKDYLETDRKKNLLRWDVTAPASKTGTDAHAVEYKFKLAFDRNMTLTERK